MVLCFGTYANILMKCALSGVTNAKMVSTLVGTIDPNNAYGDKANSTSVSRLMNCKRSFPTIAVSPTNGPVRTVDGPQTNIIALAKDISPADLAKKFDPVIALLDDDKKVAVIGALHDVIRSDEALEGTHRAIFIRCMGMPAAKVVEAEEVDLRSFLAGVFLYTVLVNENKSDPLDLQTIRAASSMERYLDYHIKFREMNSSFSAGSEPATPGNIPDGAQQYMTRLAEKYNCIPTILQKEAFTPFRYYYIPSSVRMRVRDPKRPYTYWYETIADADVEKLLGTSKYLVLSGAGGLGKSMMMRSIMMTAIEEYDSLAMVPLFIPLKDFDRPYDTFIEYVLEMVNNLWPDLTMDGLRQLLDSGSALLLFDGLDEINGSLLQLFTKQMNSFIDRYYVNRFVISSRPYTNFQSFSRFTVLELQPFSKDQALEFVDKVNYHAEAPKLQQRFRNLLDMTLYHTHTPFCGNPLLLSIMILTFELDADVPTVKHKFYQEAYMVLSRRHDALKDGYSRELKTGWKYDKLADYFAYFCTSTYRDGKVSFSYDDMERYFKDLARKYKITDVSVDDFIYDLTNNLCLMYLDGTQYAFIHRSFQEYFCAKFFNSQLDKKLTRIIPVFDQNNRTKKGDTTLQMLHEMKPKAVELYMFLPYLDALIEKCESGDGIWTFLETIYPDYEMADGDCDADEDNRAPASNLYAFILDHYHLEIDVPFLDEITDRSSLVEDTFVYREDLQEDDFASNLPYDYEEVFGEPEVTGHIYKLDWSDIHNDKLFYADLIEAIESPDFAFVKEYEAIVRLRDTLKEKNQPAEESDDFLDDME